MTPVAGLPDRDRITLAEIANYMRLSKDTIRRRVERKKFPKPIDKGRELIFCREEVLKAIRPDGADERDQDGVEDALIRAAAALPNRRTRKISEVEAAKRRKRKSRVDRPAGEATIRLVTNGPGV